LLLAALTELGAHAASLGVTLVLEPLNRYEDHMVNRLDEAVSLVDEVGLRSVRVLADTYHMNIEEDEPTSALVKAADYLGHVQVSDSNRFQPGAGHIDWGALLGTLDAVGYEGFLAVECRLRGEPSAAVAAIPGFLRRWS
jgi:sugar phosphate isomerase/epimerase